MRVMFGVTDPDERRHTVTVRKRKAEAVGVEALLARDAAFLRTIVKTALQEVLEAEKTEEVGAVKVWGIFLASSGSSSKGPSRPTSAAGALSISVATLAFTALNWRSEAPR